MTVRVEGLQETIKGFKDAGVEATDLKDAFNRIGKHVADKAKSEAPKDTGRLQSKIKASRTQNKSVITSGGTEYHRFVHFGTEKMAANPYLYEAASKETDWIERQVLIEMEQLIARVF